MVLKDCTKSFMTKALLPDATVWCDYGGRWAFNASSAATSKSPRNLIMIPLWHPPLG